VPFPAPSVGPPAFSSVQYLRGRNLLVRQRLAARPLQDIRVCSVVKSELYLGALRQFRNA